MSAREQKRTAAFIYERRTFMIRISVESPSPAFLAGEGDSVKNKHMNTEKQQLYGIWLLQNVLRKTDC